MGVRPARFEAQSGTRPRTVKSVPRPQTANASWTPDGPAASRSCRVPAGNESEAREHPGLTRNRFRQASSSWPGLTRPSAHERSGVDGRVKPGHDGRVMSRPFHSARVGRRPVANSQDSRRQRRRKRRRRLRSEFRCVSLADRGGLHQFPPSNIQAGYRVPAVIHRTSGIPQRPAEFRSGPHQETRLLLSGRR